MNAPPCHRPASDVQAASRSLEIVGAGPAGLAAALTARAADAEVTVYEKRAAVGARFHGDFQGLENWTTDEDVFEELDRLGLSLQLCTTPVREIVCFDPLGAAYPLRSASRPLFYLIKRGTAEDSLDQALARQALAAGVEIRCATRRDRLPAGGIVAEGPHAADIIAVGYTFTTDMADGYHVAISETLAPSGHAYLLVHEGRGTVASCLLRDFHQEKAYLQRVVDFFARHAGLRWQQAFRFGGTGNVFVRAPIRVASRLYAGESAGLQDALFGFGVRYALLSGHLAARAWLAGSINSSERQRHTRLRDYVYTGLIIRRLYQLLGDRGYRLVLKHAVAQRDPRQVLQRVYRPGRAKVMLGALVAKRGPTRREPMPGHESEAHDLAEATHHLV